MERNELNEKVQVLREQLSVKASDTDLATPMIQPCTAVDSQKEVITHSKRSPGGKLGVESKGTNETKCSLNDPFYVISSGH